MRFLAILVALTMSFFATLSGSYGQDWTFSSSIGGNGGITGIAAADSTDVWTVRGSQGNGEILHYNGTDWQIQTATFATQSGEHRGAYAFDSNHVWVVGNSQFPNIGRIYYYDGTVWTLQTRTIGGSNFIYDAYAEDINNVRATGNQGDIFRTTDGGISWTIDTDTGGEIWTGIHGINGDNIWVVGAQSPSQILFYNGSEWAVQTEIELGSSKYLRDVTAVAPDDVWACGDTGVMLHYDGATWGIFTELGDDLKAITSINADKIWAVSNQSQVFQYDGLAWALQTDLGGYTSQAALDASAPSDVWAGIYFGSKTYHLLLPSSNRNALDGGDYNGDGTSDIAIFRSSSGLWAVRGITRVYFGSSNDETVPGDYNGDGTTEIGIFRGTSGLWAIRGTTRAYFGSGSDLPEPGDYDGDGTADIGIFRDTSGLWAIKGVTRIYFGGSSDSPASGYYDGDSTKAIGIFRGSSGLWAIRNITRVYFGSSADTTVPGDYDGDGTWSPGIFRSSSGLWAIRGVTRIYFGTSSDQPVPADYNGNSVDDIGIFRDSSGLWAVLGVTRVYFGGTGDLPVTR